MEDMQSYIATQNIARFAQLAAAEECAEKRAVLEGLLIEAQARLAQARAQQR
jgi:hypothetical protein